MPLLLVMIHGVFEVDDRAVGNEELTEQRQRSQNQSKLVLNFVMILGQQAVFKKVVEDYELDDKVESLSGLSVNVLAVLCSFDTSRFDPLPTCLFHCISLFLTVELYLESFLFVTVRSQKLAHGLDK